MKKSLLFLAGFSAVALSVQADRLQEGYIEWPSSSDLPSYVQQWNGGTGKLTVKGETWEDENFFVSRVKPKARFYNTASQVYPSMTQYDAASNPTGTDKRYLWWVPIGDCPGDGSYHTNALPNGIYDGEVFSMWSYIDHYGNWTSPWGWSPGAFADVAHKNGVAVSGVASVPFGGISGGWSSAFASFQNLDGAAVGKFLYYHGVDGLGYNSEWSGSAPKTYITPVHDQIAAYMADRNPIYENVWYGGTNDNGGVTFDTGVQANYANIFRNASMFLNYNWNRPTTTIENSVAYAKQQNRNPFFIYAGMNQQGGEPRSGDNYPVLAQYQYSIGVWGAHNYNMFWQGRTGGGAALSTVQRYYLNTCEEWFTNGKRNPAIKMPITTNRSHRPSKDFAGMSSMMSARSVLNWDLKDEPFITYFNMGNGTFFNWHGERVSDKSWYNIGVQDYLPTWRWWFAPTFLQKDVTEGTTHMAADMTWEDAYFGGSCLQITGSTEEEYLHLFKSEFKLAAQTTIRIRYKLLEGEGDVALVMSNKGSEGTPLSFLSPTSSKTNVLTTVATSEDLRRKSLEEGAEGWQTIEYKLTAAEANRAFRNPLAVIGLQIKNAKNMKLLLGEFSLLPNSTFTTPAAPNVTLTKSLYCDMKGVDGKIIWDMPNTKTVGEPVYNSDVNASLYKVYAQEEGGEPVFMTSTTSWAAIAFAAPNTDDTKKIRFGVSAVSTDFASESEISWGEYLEKGDYTYSDEISINKTTIKVNESFELGYVDPRHSASTFKLYDTANKLVASGEGTSLKVSEGLSEIGGYDLVIDEGTASEKRYGYFVQVSSDIVGALPEIYTLTANDVTVDESSSAVSIELTDSPTVGYTGRNADGVASRAIKLNNGHIGGSNSQFKLQSGESFTIAGWFNFDKFPEDGWALMNITNKNGAWPNSNWGWCWSSVTADGVPRITFRGNQRDGGSPGELQYTFPNTKLSPGAWTHLAFVCEYTNGGFRHIFYVNGVAQDSEWKEYVKWNSGDLKSSGKNDDVCPAHIYSLQSTDDLILGGVLYQASAVDGIIDDMQIWNKALNADEVKVAMNEVSRNNVPEGLLAYWDFEDDADPDTYMFKSVGEDKTIDGYNFDLESVQNGGEGQMKKAPKAPFYISGCPFISGSAYPVVTAPTWESTDRMAEFTELESTGGNNKGQEGSAKVQFSKAGDHTVKLTLANSYGSDSREYPVFKVSGEAAIGDVVADGSDVAAYTVDDVLFVEFAQDGAYKVEVFNTAGMLVGNADLNAVAGQNARITLGAAGIYLVRVTCNGQELRTIKVVRK